MRLRILRAGLLDTIQDLGRYGHQHRGINPGGAMDRYSAGLANALLGKEITAPVLEMHFPASQILFEKSSVVCLTGADFSPFMNEKPVPLYQPILVKEGSVLMWLGWKKGARCYLSVLPDFAFEKWLGSFSTNLKAGAGGFGGRKLKKDDQLIFQTTAVLPFTEGITALPWKYNNVLEETGHIQFITGPEWNWLAPASRDGFLNEVFKITPVADRMGYRLEGKPLEQERKEQLVSSAVAFGTVQLLPTGQLIILMADHQTTGGYPRIANVTGWHLARLAQMNPGEKFKFEKTDLAMAEKKMVRQQHYLQELQKTCYEKIVNWLHANRS